MWLPELLDKMVFLENRMNQIEQYPFIYVDPENPYQQKSTPAAKLYKELLQQYTNVVKIVVKAAGTEDEAVESQLQRWCKRRNEADETGG
jgi:hypothetical protein